MLPDKADVPHLKRKNEEIEEPQKEFFVFSFKGLPPFADKVLQPGELSNLAMSGKLYGDLSRAEELGDKPAMELADKKINEYWARKDAEHAAYLARRATVVPKQDLAAAVVPKPLVWDCNICNMVNNCEKDIVCSMCDHRPDGSYEEIAEEVVAAPAALRTDPVPAAVAAVATTKPATKTPAGGKGEWLTTGRQPGVPYLKISAPPPARDTTRDTISRTQLLLWYKISSAEVDSLPSTDEKYYGRHYQSFKVADIERFYPNREKLPKV